MLAWEILPLIVSADDDTFEEDGELKGDETEFEAEDWEEDDEEFAEEDERHRQPPLREDQD